MDTFPTQELELIKDDLSWTNKEICQLSTEGLASHCKEWGPYSKCTEKHERVISVERHDIVSLSLFSGAYVKMF